MARPRASDIAGDFDANGVRVQKRCPQCGETKPVTEFHKRGAGRLLRSPCKACRLNEPKDPEYHKQYAAEWYQRKKAEKQVHYREYQRAKRRQVLLHYGGDPPCCACCGETQVAFLALDHINGGGNEHKRQLGSSTAIVHWLVRENYPPGFQVLCHNCNFAKHTCGTCPHQS